MKFAVSDLLFPGFQKFALRELAAEYGIEFFYEFGKDYYWNEELTAWGKRSLSIHAPCVAVNLADGKQRNYLKIFEKTFAYAKKCKAEFVVVHTNESLPSGDKAKLQELVIRRLRRLAELAEEYNVNMVVENVGLRTKGNVLFDLNEYAALFDVLPTAHALIDTGHAHINGWDIPTVVQSLGDKLLGMHIHDNDGSGDAHLPVGSGNIEWKKLFAAVKKYAPNATLVLEYSCGFKNAAELTEHIGKLKREYKL